MGAACLKQPGRKQLERLDEAPQGSGASNDASGAKCKESKEAPASSSASAPAEENLQQAALPTVVSAPTTVPVSAPLTVSVPGATAVESEERSTQLPGTTAEASEECPPVQNDACSERDNPAVPAPISTSPGRGGPDPAKAANSAASEWTEKKTPSLNSLPLDNEAFKSLRKYAKRNKPDKSKFMTSPERQTKEPAVPLEQAPSPSDNISDNTRSTIEEKMIGVLVKYDIFDDIDADRLKEFDDLFSKVKQTSNYEAHKKKTTKGMKHKFCTATAVCTDEETGDTKIT